MSEEKEKQSGPLDAESALKALAAVKRGLKKVYGEDTFSSKERQFRDSISTGSAVIDAEIGNGGLATGRIHEIFGDSGSGKSTLCTLVCKNAINKYPNKVVLYFDFEQAYNTEYAIDLGLNVDDPRFEFLQPTSAEEALDIALQFMSTGAVSLVVFDSVPAMLTKRELEKGFDEETMAEKARFLSKALPKLLATIKETNSTVLFVNQIRDKMSYGGGKTTPGGKALPFYSSTRLELSRIGILTQKDVPYGQIMKCYVRKNKVGRPFGVVETNLLFHKGFDYHLEIVDVARNIGLLSKSAWIELPAEHGGEKLNGREKVTQFYRDNPEYFKSLVDMVHNYQPEHEIKEVETSKPQDEEGY